MSVGKNRNKSSSKPLTPEEVAGYFGQIDTLSGGRLDSFARQGTAPVAYTQLTADDFRDLGGLGATREARARQAQGEAVSQIEADPSLSLFQRQRARQLTNRDYADQLDAIARETEAAITGLKSQEQGRAYQAALNNAALTREDLEALASIFFGGKGTTSKGKGSGFNVGLPTDTGG